MLITCRFKRLCHDVDMVSLPSNCPISAVHFPATADFTLIFAGREVETDWSGRCDTDPVTLSQQSLSVGFEELSLQICLVYFALSTLSICESISIDTTSFERSATAMVSMPRSSLPPSLVANASPCNGSCLVSLREDISPSLFAMMWSSGEILRCIDAWRRRAEYPAWRAEPDPNAGKCPANSKVLSFCKYVGLEGTAGDFEPFRR
jgi:hypothetical protein